MTRNAELVIPNDVQPANVSAEASGVPLPQAPVIRPEMATLLELTQVSGSATTAKEINAQLDRVLRDYDELTALYAENNRRIDSQLAELRTSGGDLSSRLHQLDAGLQHHGELLAQQAATAQSQVEALRREAHTALAGSEERWETRLAISNARIGSDLARLDAGIGSLDALLHAQERIIAEQRARLDQFDVAYQLLDTATRGNKARIEAVREQTEKRQTIVEARIDGLSALQREHHAKIESLKGLVGVLQSESQRLDQAIGQVSAALATHRVETRDRFRWTHLAIAGVLVVAVVGFALVKWSPAFAPASTEAAVARNDARIAEVGGQVAALSAREAAQQELDARQEASIDGVSGKLGGLERSLAELRAAVRKLQTQGAGGGVLRDSEWLLRQNPKAYTVQLVTSPSQADMARFIDRNVDQLALDSLAYSVTEGSEGQRYNLFLGVFGTVAQARAAIEALPQELRVDRPWVRQIQSVQDSLR